MTTNTALRPLIADSFIEFYEDLKIRFSPRFLAYRPHLDISLKTSKYTLVTARSTSDLLEAFKLRHQIFLEHTGSSTRAYDVDEFDHICDHLIIKDNKSNKVIGTYRIICSMFSDKFYSQGEFSLDFLLKGEEVKLELGRACIHPKHRNGSVIDMLWRGIGQYATMTNAQYLFGCSSVKTTNEQTALDMYSYLLDDGKCHNEFSIAPTDTYSMDFSHLTPKNFLDVKEMVPPLLRSYFSAGAKIQGKPAIDKEFECIDFFTLLNLSELSPLFKRRYFKEV